MGAGNWTTRSPTHLITKKNKNARQHKHSRSCTRLEDAPPTPAVVTKPTSKSTRIPAILSSPCPGKPFPRGPAHPFPRRIFGGGAVVSNSLLFTPAVSVSSTLVRAASLGGTPRLGESAPTSSSSSTSSTPRIPPIATPPRTRVFTPLFAPISGPRSDFPLALASPSMNRSIHLTAQSVAFFPHAQATKLDWSECTMFCICSRRRSRWCGLIEPSSSQKERFPIM